MFLHWFTPTFQLIPALQDPRCPLLFEKVLNSDFGSRSLFCEAEQHIHTNRPGEGGSRWDPLVRRCSAFTFANIKESVCTCARKAAKHCWHRRSETLKTSRINRGCHASLGPCLNSLCMLISVMFSPFSSLFFLAKGGRRDNLSRKSTRAPHSDFITLSLTQPLSFQK